MILAMGLGDLCYHLRVGFLAKLVLSGLFIFGLLAGQAQALDKLPPYPDDVILPLKKQGDWETLAKHIVKSTLAQQGTFDPEGDEGDIEWSKAERDSLVAAINRQFDQEIKYSHGSASLRKRVNDGKALDRVVVVTHQQPRMQKDTGQFLAQHPLFKNSPRILLASSVHPVSSKELLRQATLVRYSQGGELNSLALNSKELHLAGGHMGLCLRTTLDRVLTQNSDKEVKIFVHGPYAYNIYFKRVSQVYGKPLGDLKQMEAIKEELNNSLDGRDLKHVETLQFEENGMKGLRLNFVSKKGRRVQIHMVTQYPGHNFKTTPFGKPPQQAPGTN